LFENKLFLIKIHTEKSFSPNCVNRQTGPNPQIFVEADFLAGWNRFHGSGNFFGFLLCVCSSLKSEIRAIMHNFTPYFHKAYCSSLSLLYFQKFMCVYIYIYICRKRADFEREIDLGLIRWLSFDKLLCTSCCLSKIIF